MSSEKPTTVAAVDAEALEREALAAVTAAKTQAELDEARVRFLGRKSELKLALREVGRTADLLDSLDDVGDLLLRRPLFHHDHHLLEAFQSLCGCASGRTLNPMGFASAASGGSSPARSRAFRPGRTPS